MQQQSTESRVAVLKRAWSGRPGQLLRVLLAVLPVWWIAGNVDVAGVARYAVSLGWLNIIAVLVVAVSGFAVAAVRWRTLMGAYGARNAPGVSTLLRHNLVGAYYGLLPSGLANDALRGYRVRRFLPNITSSYTVVLVERVSGLMVLMGIALAAMFRSPTVDRSVVARALDFGLAGVFGISAVFLLAPYVIHKHPRWREALAAVPVLGGAALRIPPARSVGPLLWALLLSMGTQGLAILSIYLIGWSLTPEAGFLAYARVVPFIMLLSAVPLTPMGLGQREMLSVYFFGLIGVPAEKAVAISLMFFGVFIAVCVLGGLCHLVERLAGWETTPPDSEKPE